jgi:hypothetical protein
LPPISISENALGEDPCRAERETNPVSMIIMIERLILRRFNFIDREFIFHKIGNYLRHKYYIFLQQLRGVDRARRIAGSIEISPEL